MALLSKSNAYRILPLSVLFGLTACAPPPASIAPLNQKMTFENRKLSLKDLQSWKIDGGLAVNKGREGFSASMSWHQAGPANYKIQLSGPLGSGKIKLVNKGGQATLSDGDKQFSSSNAQQLLLNHIGYTVPVASLFYWIRGLPNPSYGFSRKTDHFGHLSQLSQNGWQITYKRYTSFKGFDLPSKVFMQKSNIKVKLVVSKWR